MPTAGFCLLKSSRGKRVEHIYIRVCMCVHSHAHIYLKRCGERGVVCDGGHSQIKRECVREESHTAPLALVPRKYLSPRSFNHDAARGYPNNWFSVMKTTDAKRIICDGTWCVPWDTTRTRSAVTITGQRFCPFQSVRIYMYIVPYNII